MHCPRCEATLRQYAFEDREALACEACGYLGVPVEHGRDAENGESWAEAFARYRAERDAQSS